MKKNNMIVHFIKHLNNASVMDLLLKVISCEETSEGSGILDWLCETDLIPCLVSKFDSSNSAEVHENAAQALVDIISVSGGVASSPLIRQLESEPIVRRSSTTFWRRSRQARRCCTVSPSPSSCWRAPPPRRPRAKRPTTRRRSPAWRSCRRHWSRPPCPASPPPPPPPLATMRPRPPQRCRRRSRPPPTAPRSSRRRCRRCFAHS
jgi:hypothetical protein